MEAGIEAFLLPPSLRATGCNREDNLNSTREVEDAIVEQSRERVRARTGGFPRALFLATKPIITKSFAVGRATMSFLF